MIDNIGAITAAIELCFRDPHNEAHLRKFDELFRPRVMAILVSVYRKDPASAEDAYQSALIRYIEIFRNGKKMGIEYDAYFVAIAKNALIDELRKSAKHVSLDEILGIPVAHEHSGLSETEIGIAFFDALSKLERRCQFLIEAAFISGMSHHDIAKRLKIQPQSVPVILSRCREAVKEHLKIK